MINERRPKKYCSEDLSKIENYEQAVNDKTQTWHCHHRREIDENKSQSQLIAEKLYYCRPAAELIFLSKSEHSKLHGHSEETHKKLSEIAKHMSPETRKKLSIANSGEKNPMFGKCGEKHPMFGRKLSWWNNGTINKRSEECPGQGWVRGRLARK